MSGTCSGCTGLMAETPVAVVNRAGLSAVGYRVGTYAQFRSTMLAAIGASTAHGLRTRNPGDFSIALLDACAIVADVLTFYDERIANEAWLRTATELTSVRELGRLVGYTLRPGSAANVYLAYRIDDPPMNADAASPGAASLPLQTLSSALGARIPAGTKVQSMPGPGQLPQLFETSDDLDARWVHNALRPRLSRPYPSGSAAIDAIMLAVGAAARMAGDRLLLCDDQGGVRLRLITAVTADPVTGGSRLTLNGGSPPSALPEPGAAFALPVNADMSDAVVGAIVDGQRRDRDALATLINRRNWSMDAFEATVNAKRAASPAGLLLSAYLVKPAALFGHNAPLWDSLPPSLLYGQRYWDGAKYETIAAVYQSSWDASTTSPAPSTLSFPGTSTSIDGSVDLDLVYPSVVPGTRLVFVDGGTTITARVSAVRIVSRNLYAMTGRVSNIVLDPASVAGGVIGSLHPRTTAVFIQDEAVPLAPLPVGGDVTGKTVMLGRCALRVAAGGWVTITGQRRDRAGRVTAQVAEVAQATLDDGFTRLVFTRDLAAVYAPETVRINANTVRATHGETITEVLGSGRADLPFQSFRLQQTNAQLPLTWTSAPVAEGVMAAITVRVNGVAWSRVGHLQGAAATDRVFALVTDQSGQTNVCFGDGVTAGARLPSGAENVTAVYRRGLGSGGLVPAGQLSMLVTRPAGVRDVTNPLAADGAADPDTVAQSRQNVPFAARTLDRVVTLEDYADFVRASPGVAKARVDLCWRAAQRVIVLTVAGPGGAAIDSGSVLSDDLLAALAGAVEAPFPILLRSYRPRSFSLAVALACDPAYLREDVQAAVQGALWTRFAFDVRAFGQPVFRSELIAVMQAVPGVVAVNITDFDATEAMPPGLRDLLTADPAALSGGDAVGAELLTIDPIPAVLSVLP